MTDQAELAIYRPVGEGGSLSALDERLLEVVGNNARITPEKLAEEVGFGLTPARAAARVHEIMTSQDWLSATEQKALLLRDLVRLRDNIWEQIESSGIKVYSEDGVPSWVEADPRWSQTMVRVIREFRTLIESMQEDVDGSNSRIREAHAAVMIAGLEAMFNRFMLRIVQAGIEIDEVFARDLLEECIPMGFTAIKSNAVQAAS